MPLPYGTTQSPTYEPWQCEDITAGPFLSPLDPKANSGGIQATEQTDSNTLADTIDDVRDLAQEFSSCRNDVNGKARRRSIHSIISRLNRLSADAYEIRELRARLWRELTWEARTQQELSNAWSETLRAMEALVKCPESTNVQQDAARQRFVEGSIDFSQSATSQVGINTTVAQLNHVRNYLSREIGPSYTPPADGEKRLGDLLCLRAKCSRAMASLLRRRGRVSKDTKTNIEKNKNQALRDAERAHAILTNEKSLLEFALCLLSRSGTPANENAKRAMELLKTSVKQGAGPLTRYELVKQYRFRYQFRDAIQQFIEITDYDTRRFHGNVTHFAAAAIGLYYERCDPDEIKQYALIALPWIEELISQDRHNARDLVDKCYLRAISGWAPEDCIAPLDHLRPMSTSTWDDLADMAKKVAEGDIGNALLLGLEDPVIWSRIGSFYAEFLQDHSVAVEFYERASHIAPLSPVFYFNKAESLAYGLGNYAAAKVSFEYAMRLKNRSYAWYKSIPHKIQRLSSEISLHLNGGVPA